MTKEEIQRVLDLSLEYYKSEVFGTNKESEKPSRERIDWIYDKIKGGSEIPNDLEEAANSYLDGVYGKMPHSDYHIAIFIAGAKWQAEQDQETIELAEDHAYLAGAVNEREKMMKEAVEGRITNAGGEFGYDVATFRYDDNHTYTVLLPHNERRKHGDKVRIIIVKEEEK